MAEEYVIDHNHHLPVYSPTCTFCGRWIIDASIPGKCVAYPDGIPLPIWLGEHDHRTPFNGDNGIMFEKREETD